MYKTNGLHVVVIPYSTSLQMMSKCGKNMSDAQLRFVCHFSVLATFDVICELLLNRHAKRWNLFVQIIGVRHVRSQKLVNRR